MALWRNSEPESFGAEKIRSFIKKRKVTLRTLKERDQQEGTSSRPVYLVIKMEQDLLEDVVDWNNLAPEVNEVSKITDEVI